jgi:hypothetical protein
VWRETEKRENDLDRAQRFQIWRHCGFLADNSVHLPAGSTKARKALSQYISPPPLSLKRMSVQENGEATLISYDADQSGLRRADHQEKLGKSTKLYTESAGIQP